MSRPNSSRWPARTAMMGVIGSKDIERGGSGVGQRSPIVGPFKGKVPTGLHITPPAEGREGGTALGHPI